MERTMRNDRDFENRTLTPEQWAELTRRVTREAHAARAQSLQALYRAVFRSLRAAGAAVFGDWPALLAVTAGTWWAAHHAWLERTRAVRALAALDDRALKDMGMHRSEIESVVLGRSWSAPTPLSTAPVCVEATRNKRRGNVDREPKQLIHCSAAA
jgi:uncharacterized protein YjiS (DUF1127 family)